MELVSVSIKGWKRFKKKVTLQTNGKLVALLGANEAGKSSILSALEFMNSSDGATQFQISRGSQASDMEIVGYYVLDENELERAGLSVPTRAVLTKKATGVAKFVLQPPPPNRDISLRKKAAAQGLRIVNHRKAEEVFSDEFLVGFNAVLNVLDSDDQDIPSDALAAIMQTSVDWKELDLSGCPIFFKEFGGLLSVLHQVESRPNPLQAANAILRDVFPSILLFDQDYRDLEAEYSVDSLATEVPLAFLCLSSVANLDLPKLIAAIDAGVPGDIETIRARANRILKAKFRRFWKQSRVWPVLVINGRTVQVLIENQGDQFTALAERSDGLRQFVALQSFAMRERAKSSILLIDEAETHLHYDAQADLIQMLYRQQLANKVIYTTHSAGCLPEDLGNGVRLARALADDPDHSEIVNRFWGSKNTGYSPLLMGMGASTLAFFPTRKALQVEGEAEMLLLPTLLRRVLELDVLGFQVVPGLSKANKSQLPISANGSGNIHYLVDGDGGGTSLKNELKKNNVDEDDISQLYVTDGSNCQLEDFIATDILTDAVNAIISKFSPGESLINSDGINSTGKFKTLEKKFKDSTQKNLQKVDVAYEILSIIVKFPNRNIVEKVHVSPFKNIAEAIMEKFKIEEVVQVT